MNMPRLHDYRENGNRAPQMFSASEMDRRLESVRGSLRSLDVEVALFTSYQNICWLSGFLYCRFGRRYGLVVDHENSTSIGAGIDGGQPWRRTHGDSMITIFMLSRIWSGMRGVSASSSIMSILNFGSCLRHTSLASRLLTYRSTSCVCA